jgi:hypothetical protein
MKDDDGRALMIEERCEVVVALNLAAEQNRHKRNAAGPTDSLQAAVIGLKSSRDAPSLVRTVRPRVAGQRFD